MCKKKAGDHGEHREEDQPDGDDLLSILEYICSGREPGSCSYVQMAPTPVFHEGLVMVLTISDLAGYGFSGL